MLFATIAYSIDAMLPALQTIGQELSPEDINKGQLIIASFVFGMGVGTLFIGPISDAFGRKKVLLAGIGMYIICSWLAWRAETLELMLFARFLQGVGVASPRIVGMALIRDLYSGHQMAKLISLAMLVFAVVPSIAPIIGTVIIYYFDWRAIFASFAIFAMIGAIWLAVRQPETLPAEARISMKFSAFAAAFKETLRNEMFVLSALVQALIFAILMALISSTQQIYDITFDEGARFPYWFAATGILATMSNLINASLVERLGMRFLITVALAVEVVICLVMTILTWMGWWPDGTYFPAYLFWSLSIMFMLGFTLGNLNTLAMEPMGHIAGMAASIVGSLSTVLGIIIAVPIGLAFDGTPLPLAVGGTFGALMRS